MESKRWDESRLAYSHKSASTKLLATENSIMVLLSMLLREICPRLFQGFGPPGEVKLPLMSFWVELLLPPVHHFRVGEGSWL